MAQCNAAVKYSAEGEARLKFNVVCVCTSALPYRVSV